MPPKRESPSVSKRSISSLKLVLTGQALALALTPSLSLLANAQGAGGFTGADVRSDVRAIPGSIIPTDVIPLPAAEERLSFGENLQLRVLQRLPARLYFNGSVETTFRLETNPFQFPSKPTFLKKFVPPPIQFMQLNAFQQNDFYRQLSFINATDIVFRVLPNVSIGWTLTPRTRVFGNFFMIRDSLMHNVQLNTTIFSIAYGVQQDIPVTRRGNMQLEVQARELLQQNGTPVFDLLPAITFSYILTPRMVLFANSLLQARGRGYFKPATRELDPFFTFGFLYQRGGWSLSSTATYVQNWRSMFRENASIPINNQSWILDFELARRLFKEIPGLQAFVRAEPIWNFGSNDTPGLAGFDYRFFWGLRMAMGKPPLTAALNQIRQQLEETEGEPPPTTPPSKSPGEPRPSAYLMPYEVSAAKPQPIHGFMTPSIAMGANQSGTLSSIHAQKDEISAIPVTYASNTYLVPAAEQIVSYDSSANNGDLSFADEQIDFDHPELASKDDAIAMLTEDELNLSMPQIVNVAAENSAVVSSSNDNDEDSQVISKVSKILKGKKNSLKPSENKKLAMNQPIKKDSKKVEMVLMPPMPAVQADSKENPFDGSGLDVSRPIMFNVVH